MPNPLTTSGMIRKIKTQELVKELTGVTIPSEQGPDYNYTWADNFATFSISHIGKDFQHLKGKTVFSKASPHYPSPKDYQIHRVVSYLHKGVLHYRLCKASEDSPYEAYLVARFYYTTDDTHQKVLKEQYDKAKVLTS